LCGLNEKSFVIISGHTFFMSFTNPRTLRLEMNEKRQQIFRSAVTYMRKEKFIFKGSFKVAVFVLGLVEGLLCRSNLNKEVRL
jgi:hypothetical protein